ncbi:MAG: hypothetical protein KJO82_11230 [Gammaproteobacteria bacterium]|nr:hypothetical protein [Gammaproteobacteria bacterium]
MKVLVVFLLSVALVGCGGTVERKGPGLETEAVRDFVATSELTEVSRMRMREQIKYKYINDYYVVVPQRKEVHLVEFQGRCPELRNRYWDAGMVDHRTNTRNLYSDRDTIRGCVIGKIFPLTDAQVVELSMLGDAPGNEQASPQPK